jgi:hypothetical protein
MHPHLSFSILCIAVLSAGCLGGAQKEQGQSPGDTIVTQSPDSQGSPGLASPAGGTGLNMSACKGHMVYLYVPGQLVEDDLPEPYAPLILFGEFAQIYFRTDDCQRASINGVDIGPAQLVSVDVPIKIKGQPTNSSAAVKLFALERLTNVQPIYDWFVAHKANSGIISLTGETAPFEMEYSKMTGKVSSEDGPLYEWSGYAGPGRTDSDEAYPVYYGPNPETDYWESHEIFQETLGDGPASFVSMPSSRISQWLNGDPANGALIGVRQLDVYTLREPDTS